MRIVIVLAVIIYTIGLWVIGLVWLMILLLPYFIIGGGIVYFIRRNLRSRHEVRTSFEQQARRERELNEQEYAAWQSALIEQKRKADRRTKALRKFDTRNP